MLRLSMSVVVLTALLGAGSAVQAQHGHWGGGHAGHGHGGYGYQGRGHGHYGHQHYGHGHGGGYYDGGAYGWGRGYTSWPGGWGYYGQRSYAPSYYGWSGGTGYNSPSYSWSASPSYGWYGGTVTQTTIVPSSENALAYGDADDAALGVWISQTGPNFQVIGLAANSPAAQAGIQTGDVIHRIDGKQFNTARELIDFISGKNTDDEVEIEFSRGGESFTANAPLSTRAVAYGLSQEQQEQFAAGQRGQTYSVMRPATDDDAQQLESEIDTLKQQVRQLQQELNQMRGTEDRGMDHSQRGQQFGPPAPPSELQPQDSRPFESRQQGIEQQPSEFQRDTSRDAFDTRRDSEQQGTEQRQFERRETQQRQFEQRETQQREIQRDSQQQNQQNEQGNRRGI